MSSIAICYFLLHILALFVHTMHSLILFLPHSFLPYPEICVTPHCVANLNIHPLLPIPVLKLFPFSLGDFHTTKQCLIICSFLAKKLNQLEPLVQEVDLT